ncbi:MAG TPA: signal peptidase I [Ruminococcus sp.]|nr:signal peptidase I [Ruminococcus sp.]
MDHSEDPVKQTADPKPLSKDEKLEAILAETAPKAPTAENDTVEAAPAEPQSAETEQPADPEPADSYNMKDFLGDTMDLIETVFLSLFCVMLVFTFLFCTANVDGDSMVPTLEDGDRLIVSRLQKHYDDGDILILNSKTAYLMDESGQPQPHQGLGKEIVKRLIATSGQQVDFNFETGIVYVDGQALDEPYVNTLTFLDRGAFSYPLTVPEGYVFVLGDNRSISRDSRDPLVGLVSEQDVVGKVVFRILPFNKIGKVS